MSPAPESRFAGFALPAAMNRLAERYGLGLGASDGAITREYGERPGRESLKMLAEEIGAEVAIRKSPVEKIAASQLPLIVLTKRGDALIIHAREKEKFTIEGREGVHQTTVDDLTPHLTGAVVMLCAGDAVADRFAQAGEYRPEKPSGNANDGDFVRWMANLLWRENKPELGQLLAASIISNLFLIALPLFIMSIYDRVIPHSAFESLATLTIGIMIILAADLGLRFVRLKFIEAIGLAIGRALQLNLYRRLLHMQLARRPRSASVITNVQGEMENACLLAPEFAVSLIADGLFALMVLGLIAYIGGGVVLAPIVGILVVAAAIYGSARLGRENAQKSALLRSARTAQINETFDSLTAVKSQGAEHALLTRFERLSQANDLVGHEARHRQRFANQAAGVLVQLIIVATLALGVMRIDAGLMSIGSLAATTILVGRAIMPVSQIVDQFSRLMILKEVLQGAFELVSLPEEKGGETDGARARAFRGGMRLHAITYRHADADIDALTEVKFSFEPGEKIGVIGRNGSGKSTLLHLLPRLYEPTSGGFSIDGHDARQYSPQRLRQEIGFMPQETVLFNDTLRANICLGQENVPEAAFERAAHLAGVDQFAARHPHGYSLQVGPRGEFLSAGERQAVGLARVLLRPRKMLVLDEPSSLMDHTAEGRMIAALKDFLQEKTLIVSTHRLRLLELTDRIIVLDGGRITADGPKDVVLAAMGAGGQEPGARAASQ